MVVCRYYLTHDNYSRPFCVYINELDNEVSVYKRDDDSSTDLKNYTKLIQKFKTDKIFIGESPFNPMTEFSGGHGPAFDGNSILLKIDENEYVFIGDQIYSFKTTNEIIKFVSPVGNNDVPYPYAIDDKDYYYFLLAPDSGILPAGCIDNKNDPYNYYYIALQHINESENIEWIYINDERYNLRSNPTPEKHYNDLTKRLGSPIYIQYKHEKKKIINKSDFIELLENYNKTIGLIPLLDVNIIEKRDW